METATFSAKRSSRATVWLIFFTVLLAGVAGYLLFQQHRYSARLNSSQQLSDGAITTTTKLSPELKRQLDAAVAVAGALPVTDAQGSVTSCADGQVLSFSDGKVVCVNLKTPAGEPVTVTQVGPPGAKGDRGDAGSNGLSGMNGSNGSNGSNGANGASGTNGLNGADGSNGQTGAVGATGATGIAGALGVTGATGARGPKGDKGDTGSAGATGAKGDIGATGVKGDRGDTGVLSTALGNGLSGSLAGQVFSLSLITKTGGGLVNDANGLGLLSSCSANQVLKWVGGAWICADDNGSSYSAGSGLKLNGTSFAFDPSAFSAISSVAGSDQVLIFDGASTKRITYDNLFGGLLGSLNYRGTWDASANTPSLTSVCSAGTKGYYYVVSTAGSTSLGGITTWNVGDWVVCNGTGWQRVQTANGVSSVFGRTGAVTAQSGDYTASQIGVTPAGGITGNNVQSALTGLDTDKLGNSLADGLIFIGNSSGKASGVALSGDISLSDNGIVTLSDSAVTSAKIADGTIAFADLASNSCSNGAVIKYNGTAWTCGTDNNTGTAYTAASTGANADSPLTVSGSTIGFSGASTTGQYWAWNGTKWALTTPATTTALTVGVPDSQTKSSNGAVIASNTIYLQTADATNPGLVSTGSQTFAGTKTFSNGVTVNSNAVSGAVLTIGAASNSNVLPISIASASNQLASFTNVNGAVTGFYTGTGSPEGVIAANVGSYYTATDTGSMYTKKSGTGNTGWTVLSAGVAASYMQATFNSTYSCGACATNDHLQFNKVNVSTGGDIALDTSSTYTTSNSAASVGRFTLKAGKTYVLNGVVNIRSSTGGAFDTVWYNVSAGANMGNGNSIYSPTNGAGDAGGGVNQVVFTPGTDTVVELRILGQASVTSIGIDANRLPSAFIQVIGGNAPVVGQTVDYINVNRKTSDQTVTNGNDMIMNNVVSGNIPYNASTGVFTLSAGKTYQLTANPSFINFTDTAGGFIQYDWVDSSTNSPIVASASGTSIPVNRNAPEMDATVAGFIYTPTSNQSIKLRVTNSSGSAGMRAGYSLASIVQVGSSAATTISMNSLSGALANGSLDNAGYTQSWNWNSLTSGNGMDVGSSATAMTGNLMNVSLTGNNAGNTGTLLNLNSNGATNAVAGLKINVLGSGLALDITGGVAFRAGTDYTGTGTQNDVNFGPNSNYRLNPASALTINSIAGGTGGKLLTLNNVSGTTITLVNQAAAGTAANRIITGNNANLVLSPDQSAQLQYDATTSRWRVLSTNAMTAKTGESTLASNFTTTSTSYVNTGMSITLPSAGTYVVTYSVDNYNGTSNYENDFQLFDGSSQVAGSISRSQNANTTATADIATKTIIVTVSGATTYQLQAKTNTGTLTIDSAMQPRLLYYSLK